MSEKDERAGIRAVMNAGFVTGPICAGLYLIVRGVFGETVIGSPLQVFGVALLVGLAGLLSGTICGLSVRLLIQRGAEMGTGWRLPIMVSSAASSAAGFAIVHFLYLAFW